jgi:hypothetical protein
VIFKRPGELFTRSLKDLRKKQMNRKFDLKLGDSTIAWSLSIEQAYEILGKLHDETYTLVTVPDKKLAYTLEDGFRRFGGKRVMCHDNGILTTFRNLVSNETGMGYLC